MALKGTHYIGILKFIMTKKIKEVVYYDYDDIVGVLKINENNFFKSKEEADEKLEEWNEGNLVLIPIGNKYNLLEVYEIPDSMDGLGCMELDEAHKIIDKIILGGVFLDSSTSICYNYSASVSHVRTRILFVYCCLFNTTKFQKDTHLRCVFFCFVV